MNAITIRINLLLLLTLTYCILGEVMAFQQPHINTNIKQYATIYKRNGVVELLVSTSIDDDAEGACTIQNQILSSAFSMCLIGSILTTPQLSNAADDKLPGMSITNYATQVFGSPLVGSTPGISTNKPIQIDPKYTTREERNAAYDEAFQQDARDRDAYYGRLAMKKRQESEQSVKQYREQLGLDGKGDTRMRVGEERVEGLASLRELKADYLSKQEQVDSSAVSASTE